jgi:hypothetical protein
MKCIKKMNQGRRPAMLAVSLYIRLYRRKVGLNWRPKQLGNWQGRRMSLLRGGYSGRNSRFRDPLPRLWPTHGSVPDPPLP